MIPLSRKEKQEKNGVSQWTYCDSSAVVHHPESVH
jgi:hypothetical protein